MTPAELNVAVLAGTAVLLVGVAAVRVSTGAGLPSLLLYLALGLVIGEAGLGLRFDDAALAQVLGTVALAVILAEGGLTTSLPVIRPIIGLAGVLATVGVAISVTVTSLLAYVLLDVDARTAVLLGAVVSSTDAAAVFAVMRTLRLRPRTRATLEAESGFNDPPVIILVTLVVSDLWDDLDPVTAFLGFLQQMGVGAVVGVAVAYAGRSVLSRVALPAAGLYPLATLAFALLGFGAAGTVGGSPFVAVYVAGLLLGNADLPHRRATLGFAEGLAWLAQIGLFVLLGLLASPARLVDAVVPALVVGVALTLVARPLSVWLCATPFGVPLREQLFVSWAGLRGAVPIVLATFPITAGLAGAERIFDVTFLLVVVFTILQGPSLPWLSRRLGVVEADQTRDLAFEHAPLEELGATVVSFDVPRTSHLAGVEVGELRLPGAAVLALVLRDGHLFAPAPASTLRVGDQLLLAVPSGEREAVEQRLRALSRAGRLAAWHGERGEVAV
ncbi:potassium/proton antiporter [Nocardioides sp. HDW12B]|uniref:potassium/proton antiporter n=1 Tax=Nocardioides sp. HDW12B TaxID=2714939 RepID=UPI00140974C0|nr:potassium/proton antiporter [Nocardioides sp. HDW12B]QIK67965.1 potassium/proton antiporter [Nocardioides sp. HDW12B]